jgi:D-3-phosphoglycerate dehydrogenase
MKNGAFLLNASRGTVVDIDALALALSGAASAAPPSTSSPRSPRPTARLRHEAPGQANVILTPHIGGSTAEAQASIGREVATSLVKFLDFGATTGAVNFPNLELAPSPGTHRIVNVHRNVPGVLRDINRIVSDVGANIHAQVLGTDAHIGYLVMDLERDVSAQVRTAMSALATDIRTRCIY